MIKSYLIIPLILLIALPLRAQVINAGVGGNSSKNLLERVDTDVIARNPDVVILMIGTNDMLNSNKMISYREYENNLKTLVQKIEPTGAKIVLMAPPPADSVYLFQRHDRKLFKETPNIKLDSVRHIITKLATEKDLGYIDLYQKFIDRNLPNHNTDLFIKNERNSGRKDGVHPTPLGYRFIAQVVFEYLKSESLLRKDQKIICFGDSITNGNGEKGVVTGKESDYPSVLFSLIASQQSD